MLHLQINQTGGYGRGRTNIAVPAQGIVDIRNALSEVLEQYGSDEGMSTGFPPVLFHNSLAACT